jgi:hypothetical protein
LRSSPTSSQEAAGLAALRGERDDFFMGYMGVSINGGIIAGWFVSWKIPVKWIYIYMYIYMYVYGYIGTS